jgi:hypothetical protein
MFVLMNNSLIIFSNTEQLSGWGTQNHGTRVPVLCPVELIWWSPDRIKLYVR